MPNDPEPLPPSPRATPDQSDPGGDPPSERDADGVDHRPQPAWPLTGLQVALLAGLVVFCLFIVSPITTASLFISALTFALMLTFRTGAATRMSPRPQALLLAFCALASVVVGIAADDLPLGLFTGIATFLFTPAPAIAEAISANTRPVRAQPIRGPE